jgi:UDP-N-acetylmuramate: L-alanyl-gamma-D-glutamyl-meso-diaminopimelate ligase
VEPGSPAWRFRLLREGRDHGVFALAVPGEHNVRNALAALAVSAEAGVPPEEARAALAAFRGVKRRLEIRGQARGVTVYDDFAHHPTAVRETLRALRAGGGGGRLVAVYEPRSYTSRTRIFQEDFARALRAADLVIVAALHLPGKVPEGERFSASALADALRAEGREARFIPAVPDIVAALSAELREGDRVVVLSNGGFGGIHEKLLRALTG